MLALSGDDVDYAKESVVAVQYRTRTADNFNPVNKIDIENKSSVNEGPVRKVIVDPMTINQQKHAGVEIPEVDAPGSQE